MSTRLTEADAERVGRKLADRNIRFNAEARGLPHTCRLVRCRRTGRCRGARLACAAALEAAVAAEQAASPDYDPAEGLKLWHQALEMAVAQLEAEAAAKPTDPRRGRAISKSAGRNATARAIKRRLKETTLNLVVGRGA